MWNWLKRLFGDRHKQGTNDWPSQIKERPAPPAGMVQGGYQPRTAVRPQLPRTGSGATFKCRNGHPLQHNTQWCMQCDAEERDRRNTGSPDYMTDPLYAYMPGNIWHHDIGRAAVSDIPDGTYTTGLVTSGPVPLDCTPAPSVTSTPDIPTMSDCSPSTSFDSGSDT